MGFSRASVTDLLVLKNELITDPQTLGYSVFISSLDYGSVAGILNVVGGGTIDPERVTAMVLQGAVDAGEFAALTSDAKTMWLSILQAAGERGLSATNSNIRAQILNIWGAGTTTRTNLGAIQTRPASRMEMLFGESTTVTPQAVGRALNQT